MEKYKQIKELQSVALLHKENEVREYYTVFRNTNKSYKIVFDNTTLPKINDWLSYTEKDMIFEFEIEEDYNPIYNPFPSRKSLLLQRMKTITDEKYLLLKQQRTNVTNNTLALFGNDRNNHSVDEYDEIWNWFFENTKSNNFEAEKLVEIMKSRTDFNSLNTLNMFWDWLNTKKI